MEASVPLVRVLRAGRSESLHRGAFVLLEDGEVLASGGDADLPTWYRSTAKPFQAMVALTSGAAEAYGFTSEELALAAGSHDGAPGHLDVARSLLEKAGLDEDALCCGGHWSIDKERHHDQARGFPADPEILPRLWSNCSGKHAAMLAAARHLGAPLDTYLAPDHPVQREITRLIAVFAGVEEDDIALGTDGCGAPVHQVPLASIARSMVRLGHPGGLPAREVGCAERIGNAMHAHPEMVAGAKRFDTDLMRTAAARVLSKGGAEGVLGVSVPERRLGLAIKVEDGRDRGYRQLAIELLRRFDVLTQEEADALAERHGRTIRNWTGREVGRLEVVA